MQYVSDGDCKRFANVVKSKLYGDVLTKLECIGHVQK